MHGISYHRLCAGVEHEAALLVGLLRQARPEQPVRTCPGWTASRLTAHLFQAFTWAAGLVETRAQVFVPPHEFVAVDDPRRWARHGGTWTQYVHDLATASLGTLASLRTGEARAQWVLAAAGRLVSALREAGPHAGPWTPVGTGGTRFWASWGALETVVHRVDAELMAGRSPGAVRLSADLSLDSVRFWLRAATAPDAQSFFGPRLTMLGGAGEALRFQVTDAAHGAPAQWLVLLTPRGPVLADEEDDAPAGMTVRGRAADLLMLLKRRASPAQAAVEVTGDARLLTHWLANVTV